MGHEAGDQLIQQVAGRMDAFCADLLQQQDSSMSGHGTFNEQARSKRKAIAARIGGDEFVLLITRLDSEKETAGIANKLISIISQPYSLEAGECLIGTSVGIAQYPRDGENTDTLLDCADRAVYEAKSRGKNQHVVYSIDLKWRSSKAGKNR